ncbi:protein WHAT'S THIS FACTOR 1, chloroplastic [Sesamum angolense]|uniref:Protein WHAT'S THIS FACTOR 1, chloroplastic n=1 Tax=Sesamum angolense TaxID=2727404 RepID=A0AAE1X3F5_9LAMI|nr:protein WHAT'S THIS FACTOR 1, chloroplastic [Sesamum angolense]
MPRPRPNSNYRVFLGNDFIHDYCTRLSYVQCRWMTSSKRVQDRSKSKRVHDLEIATEKHKVISKIQYLFEVLKEEPENIIPLRNLDQHQQAEKFGKEEEEIIEKHGEKAAENVTRMLMMAVDKRLPLDKIAHFRRDLGLPMNFRKQWVHSYPENFRVVQPFKPYDEGEYLELVSWKSSWAITKLERQGLKAGSLEFDKRAVAVMHELLSFTIEKRLGKKKKIESFEDLSDMEDKTLLGSDSEDDHVQLELGQDEITHS